MSTFSTSEYNAAQALLKLCGDNRRKKYINSIFCIMLVVIAAVFKVNCIRYFAIVDDDNGSEEDERAANLFLSCFITSNVQVPPKEIITIPEIRTPNLVSVVTKTSASVPAAEPSTSTQIPKRKSSDQELSRNAQVSVCHEEHTNMRSKIFKRKPIKYSTKMTCSDTDKENDSAAPPGSNKTSDNDSNSNKRNTCDTGTQTDDTYKLSVIKKMELTINKQQDEIKALKAQIQMLNQDTSYNDDDDESYKLMTNANDTTEPDENHRMDETFNDSSDETCGIDKAGPSRGGVKSNQVLVDRSINANTNDMIPIGNGNAMIPARIYRSINWNSYTSATRKLLTAVFTRRVLATHCLTGKRSPAFPLKPRKKKLDTALVDDIVQTVMERCRVPENVVRTSITTKCADESKMLRTSQKDKRKRKYSSGKENIPSDTESDEG